jgi:hypothetical protein
MGFRVALEIRVTAAAYATPTSCYGNPLMHAIRGQAMALISTKGFLAFFWVNVQGRKEDTALVNIKPASVSGDAEPPSTSSPPQCGIFAPAEKPGVSSPVSADRQRIPAGVLSCIYTPFDSPPDSIGAIRIRISTQTWRWEHGPWAYARADGKPGLCILFRQSAWHPTAIG